MRLVFLILSFAILALLLCACDADSPGKPSIVPDGAAADVPLLHAAAGDAWIYQVRLCIPEGVTSAGAAEVDTSYRLVRSYLGKLPAAEGLPAVDCFEVTVPGSPREREFVDLLPDRICIRGSLVPRPDSDRPLWFERPVPFVIAGMMPGTVLPDFVSTDGGIIRRTKVIAREDVTVPCGTFRCIRLLTAGNDGEIELRRTTWFSPGIGIIREEKSRYRRDQLVLRESHELVELRRSR